jgi:hypothetical protein
MEKGQGERVAARGADWLPVPGAPPPGQAGCVVPRARARVRGLGASGVPADWRQHLGL